MPYCLAESAAEVFVLSPPEPLQKRQDKKSQARQDVAQDWIEMVIYFKDAKQAGSNREAKTAAACKKMKLT